MINSTSLAHDIDPADRLSDLSASNLTVGQRRIWTGQKLDDDRPLYNMALAFLIRGNLEPDAFKHAFQTLVDRSDAMRTIITERDGIPRQQVSDQARDEMEYIDFTMDSDPGKTVQSWLQHRTIRMFDLKKRLFDSVLLKLAADEWVWYLNQHHLITDAWSCAIIFRKMGAFYALALNGHLVEAPQLPPHADYQTYERDFRKSNAYASATAYWDTKVSHPGRPLDLYGKVPPEGASRSERVLYDLGRDRSEQLRTLAQTSGFQSLNVHLSLFNIFAAVLFAYLYRISGNTRLVIGTPSHHRPTAIFKETIGLFIELFPLEVTIARRATFRSLANAIAPESLDLLRYAQPGTSKFIPGKTYSVVLNYIHSSFADFCDMPTHCIWIHPDHLDRGHVLRLQVHDFDSSGSIQLHFDMSCEIFDHELRQHAKKHVLHLLDALLNDPDQPIQDVDLLEQKERETILWHSSGTCKDRPTDKTVVDLLNRQAARTPHHIAVTDAHHSITYQDLAQESNRIAHDLRLAGIGRGGRVGVFMERSAELILAMTGILKAGGAFVPIDVSFPPARIDYVLKDCNPAVILTQANLQNLIPASNANIVCLDRPWKNDRQTPPELTAQLPTSKDLAYVIYTSGSTGKPKGVMIAHGSLANYLWWAKSHYMHDGPHDFALFTTIAADLTITSIFLPLICGSKITVYKESKDGIDLSAIDVFNDDAVDIIKLTPSHLALLVDRKIPPKRLKKLIVGGEDFKCALAHRVSGLIHGDIEIFNEYGPTEATVGCMIHRFDQALDHDRSLPIGKPIDNMRVYLLDKGLNPVPVGVKGDIYIAGSGLAKGYLNRPALTAKSFIPNPFETGETMYRSGDVGRWKALGLMEFLGRQDHQVKVRGFRIELGEIETALSSFSGIRESFVQVIDHRRDSADDVIHYCRQCGLSSKHPHARLNSQAICQICSKFDDQRDAAQHYFKNQRELSRILADAKKTSRGKYDCLMQYSGGKDSTYALYQLVEMGMHPLVFSFDNGFISEGAKANIRRVVDDLNLDLVWGQTPAMNDIFVDSLRRFSNVCNGCQKVIYTLSVNLAVEKGIGTIITGLSRGQFFETRVSGFLTNQPLNSDAVDRHIIDARKAYHRMDDAVSKHLDVSAFQDNALFDKIQFIDYYRYSDVAVNEIYAFLDQRAPWIRPKDTGRSTNCMINEAGIYIHKKERGFHNYELPYSWDVRLGHKGRDSALEELDDNIDVARVHRLLKQIGYDPEEKAFASTDRRIVAYYVADQDYSPERLRSLLSRTLPVYMLPAHFMRIDALPLNATGKIDRDALPHPQNVREGLPSDYLAPRNEVEQTLAAIWADVIGTDKVGVLDNFFDLGGDSILSIQIVARALKIGLEFTPGKLFRHPTIAELADTIESGRLDENDAHPRASDIQMADIDPGQLAKISNLLDQSDS